MKPTRTLLACCFCVLLMNCAPVKPTKPPEAFSARKAEYADCVTSNAAKLDDMTSEASSVAKAVAGVCEEQFQAVLGTDPTRPQYFGELEFQHYQRKVERERVEYPLKVILERRVAATKAAR